MDIDLEYASKLTQRVVSIEGVAHLQTLLDADVVDDVSLGVGALQVPIEINDVMQEARMRACRAAQGVSTIYSAVDPVTGVIEISGIRAERMKVEQFGPTDTAQNTKSTLQKAINSCAAAGVVLTGQPRIYEVDVSSSSITIPNNFLCDFPAGAVFKRAASLDVNDVFVNADTINGNSGLSISGLVVDGNRQADGLVNTVTANRFCGIRLVKCSGVLRNCRADNTVNGEIQAEGTRGGICLDRSVDVKAFDLFSDGTYGTGVFVYGGKNYIRGVWTKNNTGSGFSSSGADDNDFHHIYSDGSGYSGVSVNGVGMRCSFLASKNSPVDYAGVNIGHDSDGNRATGSQIDNVMVESASGWGIVLSGSPNVIGSNWQSKGSLVNNLRVINSAGLKITYCGETGGTDTLVSGTGEHFIDAQISGAAYNGVATGGSQTKVNLGPQSYITGCGTAGGTTGALNAANNTEIIMRGKVIGNLRYGVISAGGSAALVTLAGAKVMTNTAGNIFTSGGGVIRYEGAKFSNDPTSGTFTISAGVSSAVVANGNAADPNRIAIYPADTAGIVAGQPVVSALTAGTNFTASIASAAAADSLYRYVIF